MLGDSFMGHLGSCTWGLTNALIAPPTSCPHCDVRMGEGSEHTSHQDNPSMGVSTAQTCCAPLHRPGTQKQGLQEPETVFLEGHF